MHDKVKRVLLADSIPVWLTLVFLCVGAVGTYFLAPRVNAAFEAQKLKTEFVIKNLNELEDRTRALFAALALFHLNIQAKKDVDGDFTQSMSTLAQLQWNALSLTFILVDAESDKVIEEYQKALLELMVALSEAKAKSPMGDEQIQTTLKKHMEINVRVITHTLNLAAKVAELGGLKAKKSAGWFGS